MRYGVMIGWAGHPRPLPLLRSVFYLKEMSNPISARPTPWKTVLLTCGKCSRKLDGGFGPKGHDTLKSALRVALTARGQRREVRIIESRCLGICPKKAVTALNAARPGRILIVRNKTKAEEVIAWLMDGDPV
jgi:predicted metal-binding protein